MDGTLLGSLGIVAMLFGLLVLRMPPGFVMALVGFVGLVVATGFSGASSMLGSEFWTSLSKYGFTVIPLFVFVGELIHHAGYSNRIFDATHRWFGRFRGGLALTTILASAGFSAICGSNNATAATMGAVALPSMKRYGYHPILKSGAVAAGSTLGVVIPPSIVLVVYGLYTGESIGKLFCGTLIPAFVLVSLILLTVVIICRLRPDWGPAEKAYSWREKWKTLPQVADVGLLFLVIMGALCSGKVTATEAAGFTCLLALLLCFLRHRLNWKIFKATVKDTLRISCMVLMIVAGATIFGKFMTITRLPYTIAESIANSGLPSICILSLMLLCYIVGGCLMDALAFLLISLPIFMPLLGQLGYDPIWFGEVVCLVTTLGAITPPIGVCCFVISSLDEDIRIEQVFTGAILYAPAYIITIVILATMPYLTVGWLASFAR